LRLFVVARRRRARLEAIASDRNSPQKHVWRSRIILLTAAGIGTTAIMRETGVAKTCVWRWQERFMTNGIEGLLRDKTRPARIPPLNEAIVTHIVSQTLEPPAGEVTHWTAPAMAKAIGVSVSSVQRVWRKHGLQPHRIRPPMPWCFRSTRNPKFKPWIAPSRACRSRRDAPGP
jgi:transposase